MRTKSERSQLPAILLAASAYIHTPAGHALSYSWILDKADADSWSAPWEPGSSSRQAPIGSTFDQFNAAFTATDAFKFKSLNLISHSTTANGKQQTISAPLPPSAWLFSLALIGLAGISRRKR